MQYKHLLFLSLSRSILCVTSTRSSNLLYKAQFVCLSVCLSGWLYISTLLDRFGPKLAWSIFGGRDRERSGCRCIWLSFAAPSNPQKPEVPIYRQPLDRFQPKLVCGCTYYVQVSFKKIAMIKADSGEPSRQNRKCLYLKKRWTDFNQTCCMDEYSMQKNHSKISKRSSRAAPSYCPFLGSVRRRHEAPGTEMRSAESGKATITGMEDRVNHWIF